MIRTSKEYWEIQAQIWELGYWCRTLDKPKREEAEQLSKMLCEGLGISQKDLSGTILDVGCGPTGRLIALKTPKSIWYALDPLLDNYSSLPSILDCYNYLISQPCEEYLPLLKEKFDTIVSINALDHTYDLPLCLENIYKYLKPQGTAVLSFDCFDTPINDPTHPIKVSHRDASKLIKEAGFTVLHKSDHIVFFERTNWGGGTHYHWRLTK